MLAELHRLASLLRPSDLGGEMSSAVIEAQGEHFSRVLRFTWKCLRNVAPCGFMYPHGSLYLTVCVGYLGEEGTGDEDLHQHSDDELDDEENDGRRTFLGDAAETVTDGGLGLQGEEESPRQGLHLHHTGSPCTRAMRYHRTPKRNQVPANVAVNRKNL
ncbi:hypothetical protein EYF80_025900 [Liparis tanakae]|uniref:Uncharacterized protein n=1 Tax=Liparis tanakae TaxID=230148 RepID=A0A4Z2HE05_9TELE|nr:hypothetical protein EYF80_025900 [Liparis tanakae]